MSHQAWRRREDYKRSSFLQFIKSKILQMKSFIFLSLIGLATAKGCDKNAQKYCRSIGRECNLGSPSSLCFNPPDKGYCDVDAQAKCKSRGQYCDPGRNSNTCHNLKKTGENCYWKGAKNYMCKSNSCIKKDNSYVCA